MKIAFALILAVGLHSHLASGVELTYEELSDQLPITLTPGGDDQYFFFIVPVQKGDDPNIILQMAQAQSASETTNGSISATMIDTKTGQVNVTTGGADMSLDDIFQTPEMEDTNDFNFQVPVIIPLDFQFQYDAETSTTELPQCTIDTRTWKEKVISRIAEKLELPGGQSWDHSDLNVRVRLHKDALASITADHITDTDKLTLFVNKIYQTKIFADIRYASILSGITELNTGHISLIAEGVDTYQLLRHAMITAEDVIAEFKEAGDLNVDTNIAILAAEGTITGFKSGLITNTQMFQQAYIDIKALEEEENADEI